MQTRYLASLHLTVMEDGDEYGISVAFLMLGYERNRQAILDFIRSSNQSINLVSDAIQPAVSERLEWLKHELTRARERGVRVVQITDITSQNIKYCKTLATRVDELNHLGGVKTVFGVSDVSFLGMIPTTLRWDEHNIEFVESRSESVVELKKHVFDALWRRAEPSSMRFEELATSTASQRIVWDKRDLIDRFYLCVSCSKIFVLPSEVKEHKLDAGHSEYSEYPIA